METIFPARGLRASPGPWAGALAAGAGAARGGGGGVGDGRRRRGGRRGACGGLVGGVRNFDRYLEDGAVDGYTKFFHG